MDSIVWKSDFNWQNKQIYFFFFEFFTPSNIRLSVSLAARDEFLALSGQAGKLFCTGKIGSGSFQQFFARTLVASFMEAIFSSFP